MACRQASELYGVYADDAFLSPLFLTALRTVQLAVVPPL